MQFVMDPTLAITIIIFALLVGIIASMLGIGGGIINTPLLVIIFMFGPREASATALVAAFFVAISSSISYYRQKPRPTQYKAGLFLAMTTIPGSLTGVWLKGVITDDMLLRYIFAILLFPIALKMLNARRKGKTDMASQILSFDFDSLSRRRLGAALGGAFVGGVAAGLLGLGGGVIVVPVLSVIMALPMHAAVATSMFTMMFTTTAGTALNLYYGQVDILYGVLLGIGMIAGGQIGSKVACRIDAVRLKQIFGLVLVFPLIKMAKLGQMWLDPSGTSFLLATVGDIIIWLTIVIPTAIIRFVILRRNGKYIVTPTKAADD
ncbi:MAG: sulfite exporter TauE/SafE family protein [Candidatus Thorarchaeota archaeon]|nr:sulfite exporter TauE/SafE family protein [Candidatus Thorarchaeota archaeon]